MSIKELLTGNIRKPDIRYLTAVACVAMINILSLAHIMPVDGQKLTKWEIDYDLDGSIIHDSNVIDLSNAVILRSYDCKYRVYGDTLISRQALGAKEWFAVRDGEVWKVGSNDRITQRRYHRGCPYLPSSSEDKTTMDSLLSTSVGTPPLMTDIQTMLSVSEGAAFVFAGGDTVRCTRLYDEKISETLRDTLGSEPIVTRVRRWYAAGCMVPVVECVGYGFEGEEGCKVTVCPPSEQQTPTSQSSQSRASRTPAPNPAKRNGIISLIDEGAPRIIRLSDDGGTLAAVIALDPDCDIKIHVYDIAGIRMASGDRSVSVAALPTGYYIADVVYGGESHPVKFRIDR